MVRSSHHLPLPSLPPPRVLLCSPFLHVLPCLSLLLLFLLHLHLRQESSKESALRRRDIAASHLSRGPRPTESLLICKRVSPTGTTSLLPPSLAPGIYIYISMLYRETDISHAGQHFSILRNVREFHPVSPGVRNPRLNITFPRDIPITNSTSTRYIVSPGFRNTYILYTPPRECICRCRCYPRDFNCVDTCKGTNRCEF